MSRIINIQVDIDPDLLPELDCYDNVSTQRTISISVFKLIYSIGTIQIRRFAPSNRQKYTDFTDLLEVLVSNTNDFKVRINDIRNVLGSEKLKSISEDFGVGISIVVAMQLFNIRYSTIQRIYGNDKRPDWSCQTENNRILIVESKGSSSQATSNTQQARAIIQKNRRNGDVKIASLTVINENTISTNRFIDPPIYPDDMDFEIKNKILRAGHYSSVFSFLGNSALSKYYSQMRKRLLKSITPNEQNEKNNLYFELRDRYPNIPFDDKDFTGSFYNIEKNKYLYIGIDKRLLSYQGFLEFEDYNEEIDRVVNQNHYILFKDGILIIDIKHIDVFSNIILPEKIKNYQENITISDVDVMTLISFEKYVNYLLIQNGFEIRTEYKTRDFRADIVGWKNKKKYIFELKIYKKKQFYYRVTEQLIKYSQMEGVEKIVLITNVEVPEELTYYNDKLIIIGRNQLRLILKNNRKLTEMINE